jgi:hypothetical protein
VHATSGLVEQSPLLVRHSLTSTQLVAPVPLKPLGHSPQTREPGVLVQAVRGSQPPLFVWHSSMSVHVRPSPVKPVAHGPQVRDPGVFVHFASGSQPPLLVAHSSTSAQPVSPLPA